MKLIIVALIFFGGAEEHRLVSEMTCLEIQDAVYAGAGVDDLATGRRVIGADCFPQEADHNQVALGWGP